MTARQLLLFCLVLITKTYQAFSWGRNRETSWTVRSSFFLKVTKLFIILRSEKSYNFSSFNPASWAVANYKHYLACTWTWLAARIERNLKKLIGNYQ